MNREQIQILNTQQSEPQQAGLNVQANLSAIRHAQRSFTTWACWVTFAHNQPL